jgi:hypothetical protein
MSYGYGIATVWYMYDAIRLALRDHDLEHTTRQWLCSERIRATGDEEEGKRIHSGWSRPHWRAAALVTGTCYSLAKAVPYGMLWPITLPKVAYDRCVGGGGGEGGKACDMDRHFYLDRQVVGTCAARLYMLVK